MNPDTKMQALSLIDYLALPQQKAKHGADNCAFMQGTLRFHLGASTPEQNEPQLIEDIAAIKRILQMEAE